MKKVIQCVQSFRKQEETVCVKYEGTALNFPRKVHRGNFSK